MLCVFSPCNLSNRVNWHGNSFDLFGRDLGDEKFARRQFLTKVTRYDDDDVLKIPNVRDTRFYPSTGFVYGN